MECPWGPSMTFEVIHPDPKLPHAKLYHPRARVPELHAMRVVCLLKAVKGPELHAMGIVCLLRARNFGSHVCQFIVFEKNR